MLQNNSDCQNHQQFRYAFYPWHAIRTRIGSVSAGNNHFLSWLSQSKSSKSKRPENDHVLFSGLRVPGLEQMLPRAARLASRRRCWPEKAKD
jgi:hypothetical protein